MKYLFFFLIFCIAGWLYRASYGSYFFQDDWFSFRISQASTIGDFLSFFIPRSDVIYFRPLGMQIPFFIMRSLFGIEPFPYRVLTLATHFVNIVFVYILMGFITKKKTLPLLGAFLYATSSVFYTPFYWFATYAFILAPGAFFLSLILFLRYVEKNNRAFLLGSLVTFLAGLLVNEIIVTLPIILGIYLFLFGKKKRLLALIPYIGVACVLFIFRFILSPPPLVGQYSYALGKHIIRNIIGYGMWTFNWPEEMRYQIVNGFMINGAFIRGFPYFYYGFLVTLLVSAFLMFVLPIVLFIRRKDREILRIFMFGICWFLTGLLPVVFFPSHSFSYYLPIPLTGFLLTVCSLFWIIITKLRKHYALGVFVLLVIIMVNWFWSSNLTMQFNNTIHWAPQRARLSRFLVERTLKKYPIENEFDFVVIPHVKMGELFIHFSEFKLALNNQDAIVVIYGDDVRTDYVQ